MTAEVIHVDFKARQVIPEKPEETPAAEVDVARNKRLINDLKSVLDDLVEQVDLEDAVLLMPQQHSNDLYIKLNGGDIGKADTQAIGRINAKLRQAHAQP